MTARQPILVLGASGFFGPHLVAAAVQAGERVVAAARAIERVAWLEGGVPHEALVWDALEPDACARVLERTGARAVVLAAALSRVDACEREPELAAALNTELPAVLARLTHAHGLRFVHLSTDLVFGARPPQGERYDEDDPPAPVHTYGASKAAGEERVRAADPRALVVRLPLLFGDSRGRGLGASDQILAALAHGARPALFTDEWRTPLAARSAARAVLELVERDEHGFLHVAGPERISRHELGLLVLEACGLAPAEAHARLRPALRAELGFAHSRPADVSLDARRARALLATELPAPRAALRAEFTPHGADTP